MIIEGINFNEDHWKDKTVAEFIEHEKHHGLTEKQLKAAFAIIQPKKKVEKPADG